MGNEGIYIVVKFKFKWEMGNGTVNSGTRLTGKKVLQPKIFGITVRNQPAHNSIEALVCIIPSLPGGYIGLAFSAMMNRGIQMVHSAQGPNCLNYTYPG